MQQSRERANTVQLQPINFPEPLPFTNICNNIKENKTGLLSVCSFLHLLLLLLLFCPFAIKAIKHRLAHREKSYFGLLFLPPFPLGFCLQSDIRIAFLVPCTMRIDPTVFIKLRINQI